MKQKPETKQRRNFTMLPNRLINLLPIASEAAIRITLAVAGQTWGKNRDHDQISTRRLAELTGLSRQAVSDGIEEAIKLSLIARQQAGKTFSYQPVEAEELAYSVGQSKPSTGLLSRPSLAYSVGQSHVLGTNTLFNTDLDPPAYRSPDLPLIGECGRVSLKKEDYLKWAERKRATDPTIRSIEGLAISLMQSGIDDEAIRGWLDEQRARARADRELDPETRRELAAALETYRVELISATAKRQAFIRTRIRDLETILKQSAISDQLANARAAES